MKRDRESEAERKRKKDRHRQIERGWGTEWERVHPVLSRNFDLTALKTSAASFFMSV